MVLLNALKNIGFTQQEAILYIHLCKHGALTGYEAAKLSGISRSNAYAGLSSLVDKGYAYVIEGTPSKYVNVPKEELIKNAERDFQENISIINERLEFEQKQLEPYITITGEKNVINKLKNIICNAKQRIYISCDSDLLELVENELLTALTNNLKVVILSTKDLNTTFEHIYYPTKIHDSFKIIADTMEVLAGTFKQSIYSKNTTFVSLIRESFINEIAVIDLNLRNE